MISSVIFENEFSGKLEIDLRSPETSHGLWIKSIKGIGPGKADINVTDLASSDGGIFNSARSQKRNITFTIGIIETSTASVEENRRYLYKWLGKKSPVTIIFVTDPNLKGGGSNPLSNLAISGYVESNEPDIFNKQETTAISIICPDPNFYPYNSKESIGFSAIEDRFQFPFSNEELNDPIVEPYFPTSDETMQSGKTYYEQVNNEYVQTQDESFLEGKTYFEKEEIPYWVTRDTEMKPGKGYYEKISEGEYYLTADLSMQEGKTYYEYNDQIVLSNVLPISNLVIDYDGEIDIGLTFNIVISGDVTGLSIYKYDINGYDYESFSFNDSAIPGGKLVAGDEIQVNTVTGNKYCYLIRNGHYYNILNALGKDPDWLILNKGINTFSYGADTGPEYVSVYISYTKAYEGV